MICPRSAVPGTTASAEPWVQVQALSAPRVECGSYKFGARPVPIHSFSASAVAAPWRAAPFLFSWAAARGGLAACWWLTHRRWKGPTATDGTGRRSYLGTEAGGFLKNWRAYGGRRDGIPGTGSVLETPLRALKSWMLTEGKVIFPHGQ